MITTAAEVRRQAYKIGCEDGRRYVVYNASAIGNPTGHAPDKWYYRPYPLPTGLGLEAGEPFDTAEEAELAARAGQTRADDAARLD